LSDITDSGNISASDELTIIAGSVVLSDSPAHQLKYWRKRFGIKQADLARKMNITPSVLSDYEKGRRPSPGVNFIKRYLVALAELRKEGVASDDPGAPEVAAAPVVDAHINQN
jgi:putative transcriptional regulator